MSRNFNPFAAHFGDAKEPEQTESALKNRVTCNRCGKANLTWSEGHNGTFKLYEGFNTPHVCRSTKADFD